MPNTLEKHRIFSGSALKLIAVISMLIDHIGYTLCHTAPFFTAPLFSVLGKTVTVYYILRRIGRLAFPIYCFLIGEGFAHTRNQTKYLLRLLIFAVISEIPYNLMISGRILCPEHQNVFFTLFLGALSIYFLENIKRSLQKAILMLAVLAVSVVLKADYGAAGMVAILLLYVLRSHPLVQAIAGYPLFSGGIFSFAAFVPINLYNGKRGFIKSPILKYAFYLFYPLHMLALVGIRAIL